MFKPKRGLWTSEDVSLQHPDRAMDYVADYILDKYVEQDPYAHVAIDGTNKNEWVVLTGEITSTASVDINKAVIDAYKEIGYTFTPRVLNLIYEQSPDIAQGIERSEVEIGAGDQGIMIGYANIESRDYTPLALYLSKQIISKLYSYVENKNILTRITKVIDKRLIGDMKAQVTIDYSKDEPEVHTIVVACQHTEDTDLSDLKDFIKKQVLDTLNEENIKISNNLVWHINGTGKFVIGGPEGDSGEVGRKLICDSYGGYAAIGGGNTHGKDATKVDASAAYATRWLAKNIVASGLSDECEVQLGYVIGVAEPVSINVDLKGQQKTSVTEEDIEDYIKKHISLSVKGIIDRFGLRRPYRHLWSKQGYAGISNMEFAIIPPWEILNLVDELKDLIKSKEVISDLKKEND